MFGRRFVSSLLLPTSVVLISCSQVNQYTLKLMVDRLNVVTSIADNGAQGVLAYRRALEMQSPFSLVLMDLQMPGTAYSPPLIFKISHFLRLCTGWH
jgi:CheY-like chemotaxis protein